MKIKITNILTVLTLSMLILFGTVYNAPKIKAVNNLLTIATITQVNMNTIQTWLKTNKPNWYSDYNYYFWKYNNDPMLILVPKNSTSQLILADNQVDTVYQDDIDSWILKFTCSVQSPCLQYHFNSAYAYTGVDNITTPTNVYDLTIYPLYYSNVQVFTYLSLMVPPYTQTTQLTTLIGANYGIKPFPTDWAVAWGYISPTTDEQQTKELISANWGMFGWLADGINSIWSSAQPLMTGTNSWLASLGTNFTNNINSLTASTGNFFTSLGENFTNNINALSQTFNNIIAPVSTGVSDVYDSLSHLPETVSSGFEYYFVYNEDPSLIWHLKSEELLAKVPYFNSVSQFFNNLSADGTTMEPITGTVFGTLVSFDIKQAVFDPFLPVADLVKYIFRFVVWIGFAKLLWKQVQTMLNGSSVSSGAQ